MQPARQENMGSTVHKTVCASTMGPATVSQAAAAAALDTTATPVNTVGKLSQNPQVKTT